MVVSSENLRSFTICRPPDRAENNHRQEFTRQPRSVAYTLEEEEETSATRTVHQRHLRDGSIRRFRMVSPLSSLHPYEPRTVLFFRLLTSRDWNPLLFVDWNTNHHRTVWSTHDLWLVPYAWQQRHWPETKRYQSSALISWKFLRSIFRVTKRIEHRERLVRWCQRRGCLARRQIFAEMTNKEDNELVCHFCISPRFPSSQLIRLLNAHLEWNRRQLWM